MHKRWAALCLLLLTLWTLLPKAQAAGSADGMLSNLTGSSTIGIETIGPTPPPDWYYFTVTVRDEGGNPLAGVVIRLYPVLSDGSLGAAITGMDGQYMTDSNGQQKFQLPPPGGVYQIQTEHTGYQHYTSVQFQVSSDGAVVVTLKKQQAAPEEQVFTVSYEAGSGGSLSGGAASEQVANGKTPSHVPTPVPASGYRFLYWMDQDNWIVQNPSKLRITQDTRLRACFEKEQSTEQQSYTVYYRARTGGSLIGRSSETVARGSSPKYVPSIQADSGWKFIGWENQYGKIVTDPSRLSVVETTWLYACFEQINRTYTVYYRADTGGRLVGVSQETVAEGSSPKSVPTPVALAGYEFSGWVDQYGNPVVAPGWLAIRADTWLFAKFTPILKPEQETHTVYYWAETGGRLVGGWDSEVVAHGQSPQHVPTPSALDGYRFEGWMDQRGNWVKNPSALAITEDTWLRACFAEEVLLNPEDDEEVPPPTPSEPPDSNSATGSEGSNNSTGSGQSSRPSSNGGGTVADSQAESQNVLEVEPDMELPEQEEVFDVPVQQESIPEAETLPPVSDVTRQTQCHLHWYILLCIGLSTAGVLGRLWYLHTAKRENPYNTMELKQTGVQE